MMVNDDTQTGVKILSKLSNQVSTKKELKQIAVQGGQIQIASQVVFH